MLIAIPDILDAEGVARLRTIIDAGEWVDGNVTSGPQAALAKRNRQLVEGTEAARAGSAFVLDALGRSPLFFAAALPLKVFPPLFNRYEGGEDFGLHVDNAIRLQRGTDFRIRSDLSATLFLDDPDSYDGGELVIEDRFGPQVVKLPAGHVVLYPASSLHRVTPVTRGVRTASFLWLQSMVRDDGERRTLFELDEAIQAVAAANGQGEPAVVKLTGIYHNLLRRWADASHRGTVLRICRAGEAVDHDRRPPDVDQPRTRLLARAGGGGTGPWPAAVGAGRGNRRAADRRRRPAQSGKCTQDLAVRAGVDLTPARMRPPGPWRGSER